MKTVLAHGCFDLLHLGHIRHLQEARKLGDRLVVSVTDDEFVNKGPGRPRFTARERREALMALSCVDEVMINPSPDAVAVIGYVKPAIYVKGADYCDAADDPGLVREAAAISEIGGDMAFTSSRKWSSTELLREPFAGYIEAVRRVECDGPHGLVVEMVREVRDRGHRLFFIGNGGSAAIASHMATDWQRTVRTASMCFNDAALVTALANDEGYELAFARPLESHGRTGDLLFAISSSGESKSILRAVDVAKNKQMKIVTLSGFKPDNILRKMGTENFYVPSDQYRAIESAHLIVLHSLLDDAVKALT